MTTLGFTRRNQLPEPRNEAATLTSGEVATLAHEAGNNAVEGRSLVTKAFLAGAKGAEVIASFRAYVGV